MQQQVTTAVLKTVLGVAQVTDQAVLQQWLQQLVGQFIPLAPLGRHAHWHATSICVRRCIMWYPSEMPSRPASSPPAGAPEGCSAL